MVPPAVDGCWFGVGVSLFPHEAVCLFLFFFLNISFLFFKTNYFIFGCGGSSLVLGLFCRCREQGLLSSGVRSLVVEYRLCRACGLQKLRLPGSRVQAQ